MPVCPSTSPSSVWQALFSLEKGPMREGRSIAYLFIVLIVAIVTVIMVVVVVVVAVLVIEVVIVVVIK